MKLYWIGEFKVYKIQRREITDLYEARLAIYEAAKDMYKRHNQWPTCIFFPSSGKERFGVLRNLMVRHGAKEVDGYDVPYGEIWIGFQDERYLRTNMPDWVRKPHIFAEEIRYIKGPERKSRIIRRGKMVKSEST